MCVRFTQSPGGEVGGGAFLEGGGILSHPQTSELVMEVLNSNCFSKYYKIHVRDSTKTN